MSREPAKHSSSCSFHRLSTSTGRHLETGRLATSYLPTAIHSLFNHVQCLRKYSSLVQLHSAVPLAESPLSHYSVILVGSIHSLLTPRHLFHATFLFYERRVRISTARLLVENNFCIYFKGMRKFHRGTICVQFHNGRVLSTKIWRPFFTGIFIQYS